MQLIFRFPIKNNNKAEKYKKNMHSVQLNNYIRKQIKMMDNFTDEK